MMKYKFKDLRYDDKKYKKYIEKQELIKLTKVIRLEWKQYLKRIKEEKDLGELLEDELILKRKMY